MKNDYPNYIVKFEDNAFYLKGCSGIIYKNRGNRYYNIEYIMLYSGDITSIESCISNQSLKSLNGWWGMRGMKRLGEHLVRFNNIIGKEGYPVKDCIFYNEDEFLEEFFVDLLGG